MSPKTISSLASRLTRLDITFTSDRDVTIMTACLSESLGHFFKTAKSLAHIHIRFPAMLPLDLELDTIFHGTSLKNLLTLSLQGYYLAQREITTLAGRHRHTLRELRLCAVYLRPGDDGGISCLVYVKSWFTWSGFTCEISITRGIPRLPSPRMVSRSWMFSPREQVRRRKRTRFRPYRRSLPSKLG